MQFSIFVGISIYFDPLSHSGEPLGQSLRNLICMNRRKKKTVNCISWPSPQGSYFWVISVIYLLIVRTKTKSGITNSNYNKVEWILWYAIMVAYFCHHLSDCNVDLSDLYVILSDFYADLSLTRLHLKRNKSYKTCCFTINAIQMKIKLSDKST